ncbi:uncharacterized protein MONBRDRAFT_2255, partial [Monosiga brevicollis MX1]
VAAILPASGTGSRTGASTAKQFWMIEGRPLLYYTLRTMESVAWLHDVIVPVSQDMMADMRVWLQTWGFVKTRLVVGGDTRHRSIANGLKALRPTTTLVLVHDMVRPFVLPSDLEAVVEAAAEYGAAGCTLPLVSTVVKPSADGFLDHVLTRSEYLASQTPQAFQRSILEAAYASCSAEDFDHGTEVLQLAQRYAGCSAKLVDVRPNVWKVTYKHDLYAAEAMIK